MITNVSIRAIDEGLIDFFYPTFTRLKEYSPFIDGGVIYEGDSKYLQSFRDAGIPYIYVKGTPEYDLTIPENLINFVYNKWNKKPPKKIMEYILTLNLNHKNDLQELIDIAKIVWVTGKCSLEDDNEKSMEKLYEYLASRGEYDIICEYLTLSEELNSDKLFYKVQRFLEDVNRLDSIKSAWVRTKVQNFKGSRGKNVKDALMSFLYSKSDNDDIKMIKLFESLTKVR